MNHVVTIGDIIKVASIVGGGALVVGMLLYVIAAFGRGMSR